MASSTTFESPAFSLERNCPASRSTMDSTSADRCRRKLRPSFVEENSCCSREDSASYRSFNSLLSGDCVGMLAFLISPGIMPPESESLRELRCTEWHDPSRKSDRYEASQLYPSSPCCERSS